MLWARRMPHFGGTALLQVARRGPCTATTLGEALQLDTHANRCFAPLGSLDAGKAEGWRPFATVMTFQAGLSPQLSLMVRTNRLLYALKQGYRYCEVNDQLDPTRAPSWGKLVLASALLQSASASGYLLFIDADALVVDLTIRLEDLVAAHDAGRGAALVLSSEYFRGGPPSRINMGVFLAAQGPRAVAILTKAYNRHINGHFFQEQEAMNDYMAAADRREVEQRRHAAEAASAVADPAAAGVQSQGGAASTSANSASPAGSGVIIVDHSVFNQHRNFYSGAPHAAFIVHWAGPLGGVDKLTAMQHDIARHEELRRSVSPDASEAGAPVCMGDPEITLSQRSTNWRVVR